MKPIQANSSTSRFPVWTNGNSVADKLQAREVKRAAKSAERKQKSDKLKEQGNVFFRDGRYRKAADSYQKAIDVHGNAAKPVLLTNLAAAYLKLELYDEAQTAADRALEADPRFVKARFHRGVARRRLNMMTTAAIDLRNVLHLDPGNRQAEEELALVEPALPEYEDDASDDVAHHYSDDEGPAPDEEGYLTDSMSESSDCEHTGNGVPCKYYNRSGCARGNACWFSHAPDNDSERDRLGRNVCIYYLMGTCKFGAERCNYAHSKEFLRPTGWWSTPEGVTRAKNLYKFRQSIDQALVRSGEASKPTMYPKPTMRGLPKKRLNAKDAHPCPYRHAAGSCWGATKPSQPSESSESEWEDEIYGGIFGFSDREVNELLSCGVKPWDDDARDFLKQLHDNF